MKPETLRLLEEDIGNALQDSGARRDVTNRTPFAQELGPTNGTFIKPKIYTAKETIV